MLSDRTNADGKLAPNVDHLTPFQAVKNELDPSLDLDIKCQSTMASLTKRNPLSGCKQAACITIVYLNGR